MRSLSFWIKFVFHLLFLTVPFFFTWVNEELFEFNKMLLVYAYTAIIAGLWLSEMIIHKKIVFKKTPLDLPILLFLAAMLLSTLFSMHPRTSLLGYYTRFHGGLFSTISYMVLFYAFVAHVSKRDLGRFWLTISIAAVGISIYGISEHFGHSPSCLLINSSFQSQIGENLGWWQLFGVDCWVQDVKSRVFATFGQPNWLAAYVITLIPVTFSLTMIANRAKQRVEKWWYALATLLMTVVLLFTQSRSGLAGLGVGMLVLVGGLAWLWKKETNRLGQLAFVSLLVLAPIAYWGTPYTPGIKSLIGLAQQPAPAAVAEAQPSQEVQPANRLDLGGTDSGEIRKIVWAGTIDIWKRYLLIGSGVETFAYSYYQDRPLAHNLVSEWDFLYNKAHNEFLNYLATTGAIGLAAYLILLVSFAALGWKAYRKLGSSDPDTAVLALALVAGLISLSISNFFGFSTVMVTVLLFLYPAFILVLQQPKSVAEKTETDAEGKVSIDSASGFGLVMVWLVVLYCLVAVHSIWRADHLYYQAKQLNQQQQYFESVPLLEKAISLSSREALFYQELGYTYAQLAVLLAINEENESAAQLVDLAEKTSQQALRLNPVHLNFHKALARTYIVLAQITPEALAKAKLTLDQAQLLAPTDAKITYNRSLIALDLGEVDQAEQLMLKAIEMKPDYEPVYLRLAQTYAEQGRFDEALEQYRLILDTIAPHKTEIQEIINQLEQQAATASAQP